MPSCTPQADVKNNVIKLPSDVKKENQYGALANLMHEAAHLNHTKKIPEGLFKDKLRHGIMNAIEDVRIDRKNFRILPNVEEFYRRGMKFDLEKRAEVDLKMVPLHKKVLVNSIYEMEEMDEGKIPEKEIGEFQRKHNVIPTMEGAISDIECRRWDALKKKVETLYKAFGFDKLPPQPKCPMCAGSGKISPEHGKQLSGDGQGGKGDIQCPMCGGTGELDADLSQLMGNQAIWAGAGQGHGDATGTSELGEIAVKDMTKQKFQELLNIKETKTIENGTMLNTDNLTAFFTGDMDALFKDEKIVRRKKSQITLLLDASGSMTTNLLDGKYRRVAVSGCCKALVEILEELGAIEGLNIDWQISAFNSTYHPLSKENWQIEYSKISGGTDLYRAFKEATNELITNQDLDGNKLIIVFSDGDVADDEIKEMKNYAIRHGSDVKALIIGVGSDLDSAMVQEIVGDNNILAVEHADEILMEAVMQLLEA